MRDGETITAIRAAVRNGNLRVLVSSNEGGVPFDVRHVRVVYYDVRDPFWGTKLIEKVAEDILSALKKPGEAVLFPKKK